MKEKLTKVLKLFILPTFEQFKKVQPPRKAELVLSHKAGRSTFIETGTEFGTMLNLVADRFAEVRSIELDPTKHENAKSAFPSALLFCGDSGALLPHILSPQPTVFWLDAHDGGDFSVFKPTHYPVIRELRAILPRNGDVILIDDARHFDVLSLLALRVLSWWFGKRLSTVDGLFILV